jgi:arsenate reductase
MNEVGIDISKQRSKDLTDDMIRNADKIINMGCMDKNFCPTLFVPKVIEWGIEDPKLKPIEKVREIRDEIERRIKELAADISVAEESISRQTNNKSKKVYTRQTHSKTDVEKSNK